MFRPGSLPPHCGQSSPLTAMAETRKARPQQASWREGRSGRVMRKSGWSFLQLPGAPDSHGPVGAGGRQLFSLRTEGQIDNRSLVTSQGEDFIARARIKEL